MKKAYVPKRFRNDTFTPKRATRKDPAYPLVMAISAINRKIDIYSRKCNLAGRKETRHYSDGIVDDWCYCVYDLSRVRPPVFIWDEATEQWYGNADLPADKHPLMPHLKLEKPIIYLNNSDMMLLARYGVVGMLEVKLDPRHRFVYWLNGEKREMLWVFNH